nr:hypothetical protein [Tanacetum cinerariifolium]
RHQPRLPAPAEHAARRAGGGDQPQHLRPSRRPGEDDRDRADGERAPGDDPHRWQADGEDADLPCVRHVSAVAGCDLDPDRHQIALVQQGRVDDAVGQR